MVRDSRWVSTLETGRADAHNRTVTDVCRRYCKPIPLRRIQRYEISQIPTPRTSDMYICIHVLRIKFSAHSTADLTTVDADFKIRAAVVFQGISHCSPISAKRYSQCQAVRGTQTRVDARRRKPSRPSRSSCAECRGWYPMTMCLYVIQIGRAA